MASRDLLKQSNDIFPSFKLTYDRKNEEVTELNCHSRYVRLSVINLVDGH